MTADEVIELRKLWSEYNFGKYLPEATVLASRDWLTYVYSMAELVPRDQPMITWPSEEEVRWDWSEGVVLVLDEPLQIVHTITSRDTPGHPPGTKIEDVPPHSENQLCAGIGFGVGTLIPTRAVGDLLTLGVGDVYGIPIIFIGTDPLDIISATWIPSGTSYVHANTAEVSQSTCFILSVITALGHRLTTVGEPLYAGRGERRRVQRSLPSLRVLRLSSGASGRAQEGTGAVAWSHRWLVRGHWHTVAHGPHKSLRRLQWYDPYVKGPEDKPFDDRRTVWRT